LISGIDDGIAGRFRSNQEYVRIGTYIAEDPVNIEKEIWRIIYEFSTQDSTDFVYKISKFHLDFENIHPFVDGNGRIGRALMNLQLQNINLPNIIIRDKEKEKYYQAFKVYRAKNDQTKMQEIVSLALTESLHKRIAYLQGAKIIKLSEYAKTHKIRLSSIINKARRQTVTAFREKGVWKISEKFRI
jgi:Fic family protein